MKSQTLPHPDRGPLVAGRDRRPHMTQVGAEASVRLRPSSRDVARSAHRAPVTIVAGLRGLAIGAMAVTVAAVAIAGQNLHLLGALGDGLIAVALLGLAMAGLNGVLSALTWVIRRGLRLVNTSRPIGRAGLLGVVLEATPHPLVATTASIALIVLLARDGGPLSIFSAIVPFEILIVAGALVGLMGGVGWSLRRSGVGKMARVGGTVAMTSAILLGAATGAWAVLPGFGDPIVSESPSVLAAIPQLDLSDPSLPGPHAVVTATYGSGVDGRRPEFGRDATWQTATVDASGALPPRDGIAALYADAMWGFERDALPVNGLVWYADDTPSPMPVVLVVHGNHAAGDYSDPGYAYLGEHFASHGMLAVSVDENFLNGDAFFDYGGAEMGVRAWLLLRHLEQLRAWNDDTTHPLGGRVDLDRVALIGHSRGGEAAALASALEAGDREVGGMSYTPRGFGIRTVVAIAPSDGMYHGTAVSLSDVDYLVLQGAHDGDLPGFSGLRTYHRVSFSGGDHLKVALYSERANHGRFNTVWGDGDAGPVHSWMLERGSFLEPEEQQRLAKTAIGAFLARSLEGRTEYDAFFREPRSGRAWLPDDVIETHWETSGRVSPADLGSTRLDGAEIVATGFTDAARHDPMLRDGTTQTDNAVQLRWSSAASLEIAISAGVAREIDPEGWLTVSLAAPTDNPPAPELVLRSRDGEISVVSLADAAPVRPMLPVRLWKIDGLGDRYLPAERLHWPAERFMQTYAVSLTLFADANPTIDLNDLEAVSVRFAGAGEVFLDDVAFEPGS